MDEKISYKVEEAKTPEITDISLSQFMIMRAMNKGSEEFDSTLEQIGMQKVTKSDKFKLL